MNRQARCSLPGIDRNISRALGVDLIRSKRRSCILPKFVETKPKKKEFGRLLSEDFEEIIEQGVDGNCQVSVLNAGFYLRKGKRKNTNNEKLENESADFLEDFVDVKQKTKFELIDEYKDDFSLLDLRKALLRIRSSAVELSKLLISSQYFDYFIILMILLNIFILALEYSTDTNDLLNALDEFCLIIYTIESIVKILAMGFIANTGSYLRDNWNKMDFTIVLTGWLALLSNNIVNLASFRTLRILRPLRSISSISGLRVLLIALIKSSIPLLASLLVLFFYLLIFSIAAMQLMGGAFKFQCMYLDTGIYTGLSCGNCACEFDQLCANSLDNPNYGVTNFDNIFSALLIVFQCVTLEGWTSVMIGGQKTFSDFAVLFFVPLVFIGAYLVLSVILAVIKNSFGKAIKEAQEQLKNKSINQEREKPNKIKAFIQEQSPEDSREASSEEVQQEQEDGKQTFNEISLKNRGIHTKIVSNMQHCVEFEVEEQSLEESVSLCSPLDQCNKIELMETARPAVPQELASAPIDNKQVVKTMCTSNPTNLNFNNAFITFRKKRTYRPGLEMFDAYDLNEKVSVLKFVISTGPLQICPSAVDVLPVAEIESFVRISQKFVYSEQETDPLEEEQRLKRENMQKKNPRFGEIRIFFKVSLKLNKKTAFLQFFMKPKQMIQTVQLRDLMTQSTLGIWSGFDINRYKDHSGLVWRLNQMKFQGKYRFALKKYQCSASLITDSQRFRIFMISCVVLNTVVLSIDYYGISVELSNDLSTINTCFTYVFLVEMVMKMLAKGIIGYFREQMNFFDAVVVILSICELVFVSGSKSTLSAFRAVRVFRVIRVIRVARLFRYLKSMTLIMKVISKSLSKFIYLALLLLLFWIIYTLLGMQVFKGQFSFRNGTPRSNFDTFNNSFITTFQVLSIDNWNKILYDAMRSSAGISGAILLISWIILGNYVLLNLFLAILLEGFNTKYLESNPVTDDKREVRGSIIKRTLFGNLEGRIRRKQEAKKKMMKDLYFESEDSEQESKILRAATLKRTFFESVSCDKSYFIFTKDSAFRIFCYNWTKTKSFEYSVLLIICCSTVKVAADTYLFDYPSTSMTVQVMNYLDIIFTALYVLEFCLKSIALGFYEGHSSYIRDTWNFFDFIIVLLSVIDLAVSSVSLSGVKSVRVLRTLRPLRFISQNESMRIVVVALFDSLVAIFNVIVVLLIVWLMFAILGVSLLAGKLYSCSNSVITDRERCLSAGFLWQTAEPNYDNILNAVKTLFILSSEEGWPEIMYQAIDGYSVDSAPVRDSNPYIAYYFVVFMIIGAFFFMNFFIGVVFDKFTLAKRSEMSTASLILTKEQALWVEIQSLLVRAKPYAEIEVERSKIRQICSRVYKSKGFELFIIFVIFVNIIQMSMAYNGASPQYLSILENINLSITFVFCFEALLKLIGAGPKAYFYNNWNKFDFFVVFTSLLDIFFTFFLNSSTTLLRIVPQLFKVLRVLRISKIIRIFRALKALNNLVNVIGYSLPAILNVLSLMTLIFFIYAVLGVNLYHSVKGGRIISAYTNFNNFTQAMITLFRISTGEDWYLMMYDCQSVVNSTVTSIYFMTFITITSFVMLNFFIMVILETYEDYEKDPFHIFKKFTHDIKKIKRIWGKFSDKNNVHRIHFRDLINLMKDLTSDFGDFTQLSYEKMMKKLSALQIEIDSFGFIYYNDFLFSILKLKYRNRVGKEDLLNKKILQKEEQSTLKKLSKLRSSFQQQFYTDYQLSQLKDNKNLEKIHKVTSGPFKTSQSKCHAS